MGGVRDTASKIPTLTFSRRKRFFCWREFTNILRFMGDSTFDSFTSILFTRSVNVLKSRSASAIPTASWEFPIESEVSALGLIAIPFVK